jgi:hypothetical protein
MCNSLIVYTFNNTFLLYGLDSLVRDSTGSGALNEQIVGMVIYYNQGIVSHRQAQSG